MGQGHSLVTWGDVFPFLEAEDKETGEQIKRLELEQKSLHPKNDIQRLQYSQIEQEQLQRIQDAIRTLIKAKKGYAPRFR